MSDFRKNEEKNSDLKKIRWETISTKTGETRKKAAKIRGNSGLTPVARGWLRA